MWDNKLGYSHHLAKELGPDYEKIVNIGVYFQESEISNSQIMKYKNWLIKWHWMAKYDYKSNDEFDIWVVESRLAEFFEKDPGKFLERVAKGPPPCYWMSAWRIISRVKDSKVDGLY